MAVFFSSQNAPQSRTPSGAKRLSVGPIPPNRMEVAVHTQLEQYPDLYASMDSDGQLYDKSQGLTIGSDVERGQEQ
jgi:hypothetical protein